MCRPALALTSLAWVMISSAHAAESTFEFKGYYKNLLSHSRTVLPPSEDYWLDTNRLRLEVRERPVEWFGYEVQYDQEALFGDYLQTTQFEQLSAFPPTTYWDLEDDYLNRTSMQLRHRLYRGFVDFAAASTNLRLGRQRIAWGSGRLWNPTDILNPFNPVQLEPQERTGVDAALLEQSFTALSRLSAVYAPQRDTSDSVALRYRTNASGTDVSALLGEFRGHDVFGLDLSGHWGGAGIYMEAAYTRPESGGDFVRAVIGINYAFANTVTLSAELYWNGEGAEDEADYDWMRLLSGQIQNVARRYVGSLLSYEFTPLLRTENALIFNGDDQSVFFAPRLIYSVAPNWDLAAGLQLFGGPTGSEYGRFENVYYAYVQWFY